MGPPPSKGVNPLVFIIGGLVIVALIVGGIVAFGMSKNNSSSGSPSASGSHPAGSPSTAAVTPTPVPTTSTSGSLVFSPSTLDCANPVDFVTTLRLPATVKSGDQITAKLDGIKLGTVPITAGGDTTIQADGSWLEVSTDTAANMQTDCNRGGKSSSGQNVLTAGVHTYQLYDANGTLLAQGSYTVTGTTPVPVETATPGASVGSISYDPAALSCTAPSAWTATIRLPASVQSGDVITEKLDGHTVLTGHISVTESTIHESDGSWTWVASYTASQIQALCDNGGQNSDGINVLTPGSHTISVYDSNNVLISEGAYTVSN